MLLKEKLIVKTMQFKVNLKCKVFRNRVNVSFLPVSPFQTRLRDRCESPQLLMDTKMIYPVTFPFNPSSLALETIQIPSSLNLGFLTRV